MPLWIKITIVAVLGIGLSIATYQFVGFKLDAEHEQYMQGLIIVHSTATDEITIEESPSEDTASSTESGASKNSFDFLLQNADSESNFLTNSAGLVRLERSNLSIEIGVVTFDEIKFEVGESWTDETSLETYTITKIIKTPNQVQLYYETGDGTEYVFILDEDDDGGYQIQGAEEEIIIQVDTDPDDTDPDPDTDDTPTTTDDGNPDDTDPDPDTTPDSDPDPEDPIEEEPEYVVIDTSTTTDDGNPDDTDPDPDTTPDSDPDPEDPIEEEPEDTSTTTTPIIDTTPTTTDPDPQPYNDGTYQYKANPQYVPYTEPLYDRDYGDDIGVDS